MVVGLEVGPNDEVSGVKTYFGITFRSRAVVLTTGTFMNGTIWVGRQSMSAGRCGGCRGRMPRAGVEMGAAGAKQHGLGGVLGSVRRTEARTGTELQLSRCQHRCRS